MVISAAGVTCSFDFVVANSIFVAADNVAVVVAAEEAFAVAVVDDYVECLTDFDWPVAGRYFDWHRHQ